MLRDALLTFIGSPLSLVGGLGIGFPTDPYDVLGTGPGTAPQNIIGNAALFGSDLGVGGMQPEMVVTIGTALATSDAATLNGQFQAAPDTGAGGGYQPGTWQTIVEQGPITAAQGTAGAYIMRFKWPPVFPVSLRPRFYRFNFAVLTGTQFTAGTISQAFITTVRDDYSIAQAAKNFTVA